MKNQNIDIIKETAATVHDIALKLDKPLIFLYDVLNDFFDNCESTENRTEGNLIEMWYQAHHYKIYIEAVIDYIMRTSEQLNTLYNQLEENSIPMLVEYK